MGSFSGLLEKYHLKKWFQRDNLLILVLAGILLVVISLPTKEADEEERKDGIVQESSIVSTDVAEESEGTQPFDDMYEYTEYLEKKLAGILMQMKGVGKVSVMITLEASQKQVVEREESLSRNNTAETDSKGGNRSIYQTSTGEQVIYDKTENGQSPYVSQTIYPEVSGVLIVAAGAESVSVKKSIMEIAGALFDIELHKISVVSMNEKTSG